MTPLFQVDAFTSDAFAGNPAGVCLLDGPVDAGWMQRVAAEVNVAETAFTYDLGDGRRSLRWFTPTVEVPLCGHATLATAHVLRTERDVATPIVFDTASGNLVAGVDGDGRLVLDLPANPPTAAPAPDALVRAVGVTPVATASAPGDWWLLEVATEAEVLAAAPDSAALAAASSHGVVVTAPGDEVPVVSRMFAPGIGIDEDPVTGAAHCLLGPWWAERAGTSFAARQLSARGGSVQVTVDGERVRLGGAAVTVFRGELLARPVPAYTRTSPAGAGLVEP